MVSLQKNLYLPDWAHAFFKKNYKRTFNTPAKRMQLAIELSVLNIKYGTGGPFGAAVFNNKNQQLLAIGVNQVVPQNASIAHAEIMALTLAQETLSHYDLNSTAISPLILTTSAQPCIQCFGAIYWSGIKHVEIGARATDVKKITGFDEGPLPLFWRWHWQRKGITAQTDIMRHEAISALKTYMQNNGIIYNSRTR